MQRDRAVAVARDLGLSERQCYRDRAAICEHLARYVSTAPAEAVATATRSFDHLDIGFESCAQLADLGYDDEAARRYAEIARTQEADATKLRALALLGEVLLVGGKPDRARAELEHARAVFRAGRHEMTATERETGACRIALASAKVAWDSADFRSATVESREAVTRCERILADRAVPDVALCADAFMTRALFAQKYGRSAEARDMLARASALVPQHHSTRLEFETTLMSATFDASFRVGSSETAAELRLNQLHRVRDAAITARHFKIAVRATLALSSEYGVHRDSAAVVEYARKALAMSREIGGKRFVSAITVGALDAISVTGEARLASELLSSACESVPGSFDWILWKMFRSWADTRMRNYDSARMAAQDAERASRRSENWRLHAAVQRQLAEIAHRTGMPAEARDYIERALDGTARLGSASSRLMTLSAAAAITSDATLKREARELRSAMSA